MRFFTTGLHKKHILCIFKRIMLSYSELKPGTTFIVDGEPYQVLEYNFLRMQQRKPVAQTKIKNLKTGKIVQRMFHQNESFPEANIEKQKAVFLYTNRGEYWFHKPGNPKERFMLKETIIGEAGHFLVPNTEIMTDVFEGEIINIEIPIKMDFKVKEAPPGIKGDSATGGAKEIIIETGYKLKTPLFINEGDIIRINTQTGAYVERVEKR